MTIFGYASIIISVIGIICTLIILWQYVTGRDYWGQDRDSMIGPSAVASIIPGLNVLYWAIVLVLIVVAYSFGGLLMMRENAIAKRNKK